jgi:hypothetical protein
MAGIKETKDIVTLGASLSEAVYHSLKDGRVSFGDYVNFIPVLGDLLPALGGIEEIPGEIVDLDEAEMDELKLHFKSEFDIPDDLIEEFVENALEMGQLVLSQVKLFRAWKER